MTLILTRISRANVLQVADRLVTKGGQTHDSQANKTIVYAARDGIITIGYTGLAYLGGKPTDAYLVQEITGLELRPEMTLRDGPYDQVDLGSALRRICAAFNRLDKELQPLGDVWRRTEICAAGWQWKRNWRYRPIFAEISYSSPAGKFEIDYVERYWHVACTSLLAVAPAGKLASGRPRELLARTRSAATLDEAEAILVKEIRAVAETTPEVGTDCMSVYVSSPWHRRVRVKFLPGTREVPLDHAFQPWVLGPLAIHAPSVIRGTWEARIGFYHVVIDAPDESFPYITEAQRRPPEK